MNIEIAVKAIRIAKIACSQCDTPITTDPKEEEEWIYFECVTCGMQDSLDYILRHHGTALRLLSVAIMIEEELKNGQLEKIS